MTGQPVANEPPLDATADGAGAQGALARPDQPAVVSIVSGRPDPEELAALVAVLSSLGGGAPEPEPSRSAWSDPSRRLGDLRPRRGGWRSSGLPH